MSDDLKQIRQYVESCPRKSITDKKARAKALALLDARIAREEEAAKDARELEVLRYFWPYTWAEKWWKPSPGDRIRELEKAGALIAAEIDRLQFRG